MIYAEDPLETNIEQTKKKENFQQFVTQKPLLFFLQKTEKKLKFQGNF
jgi:hypothetical protein